MRSAGVLAGWPGGVLAAGSGRIWSIVRRLPLLALCVALLPFTLGAAPAATRILFIGNSLTYSNDMPGMVKRLAEASGHRVEITTVAFPDFSLEDHLRDARTLAALERQWDIVILQQGPSALESSRVALLRDTRALAARIRKKGKPKIALLMVWPARSRAGDFPRVAESYRLAADAISGVLIPAGTAWQTAMRERPGLELYSADGFHPSAAGSYIAAVAVHRTVL